MPFYLLWSVFFYFKLDLACVQYMVINWLVSMFAFYIHCMYVCTYITYIPDVGLHLQSVTLSLVGRYYSMMTNSKRDFVQGFHLRGERVAVFSVWSSSEITFWRSGNRADPLPPRWLLWPTSKPNRPTGMQPVTFTPRWPPLNTSQAPKPAHLPMMQSAHSELVCGQQRTKSTKLTSPTEHSLFTQPAQLAVCLF